jgi:homoserine dehydrogenase
VASDPIAVLKFGSSVLASAKDLPDAVHEIYRYRRSGRRVVAVVSALGRTTDDLLAAAHGLAASPDPAALAALLATGEAAAAALLGLALERAGIPYCLLDPWRVALHTAGPLLDAEPCELNARELLRVLDQQQVVVLSGFVGQDAEDRPSLLGRGGSDLTALFVAHRIGASSCRLLKDVDGLYERDPAAAGAPRRYATVSWDQALAVGGGVVQPKAVCYAQRYGLAFEVATPGAAAITVVGPGPSQLTCREGRSPRLRVALLGLGTVGLGVYRYLAARPDRFEVAGVSVRHLEKHRDEVVPKALLAADPWLTLEVPSDLVVEAIGGEELASALVEAALERGRDVVTANKAVVAAHGPALAQLAAQRGVRLLYSATVGGGVPVVETVERVARGGPIVSVEGVLNATTTYVLDQIIAGSDLVDAVRSAQQHGFAEADPSCDLDGTDAAHKLVIVARAAFGVDLDIRLLRYRGIAHLDPEKIRLAQASGFVVRLVASCRRAQGGIVAEVGPMFLPAHHPLAQVKREENRILIQPLAGTPVVVDGKGAGRWPTSESVFADIMEIYRLRRSAGEEPALQQLSVRSWDDGVWMDSPRA